MRPSDVVRQNLREFLEEARLSQSALLERLRDGFGSGMDQAGLSRKLSGERQISLDELVLFAEALDVSPIDLLLPREASGVLELSDMSSQTFARARSWIRGRRRPGRFEGVSESVRELQDEFTLRRLKENAQEQARLEQALAEQQRDVSAASQRLAELSRQQSMFDDFAAEDQADAMQEVQRATERMNETKRSLDQLREEARQLLDEARGEDWLDPDDDPFA